MKTLKVTTFFLCIIFFSCAGIHIYPGEALIVSRSFNNSLQDSAMICGYVFDALEENPLWNWTISVVGNTEMTTNTDSNGYFLIKLLPGTYNIICSEDTPKLYNIKILPNEKIEVRFLKKVVVW